MSASHQGFPGEETSGGGASPGGSDREAPALLEWYDRHRRDLPWRESTDPYRVWLSEVMLQQTRVETVLPYYERFLERFPSVEDLAAAEVEEVLAQWSGLGYYRRARQLHRAAGQVVRRGFPKTLEGLRRLPGIGPYTAAAVGSIAFGLAEPVLDGNVERVVSRLLATDENPKSAAGRRALLDRARNLLDPERPGDSNQALMELGATLCTPISPGCPSCPLAPGCRARAEGCPEVYPPPRKRRRTERRRRAMMVVRPTADGADEDAVLLYRRPDDARLLAGTWELPWVDLGAEVGKGTAAGDGHADPEGLAAELADRYGGTWRVGERLGQVRHGITHRSFEIEIYRAVLEVTVVAKLAEGGAGGGQEAGFYGAERRRELPLSSLVGKVLEAVAENGR